MALKKDFLKTHKSSNNNHDIIRYDEDINYLINAGLPLNTQTKENKETLLHVAVWEGQVRSVKRLIALGAKMDIQDISGNTPLHLAVIKQDIAMIKLFIEANDIDIETLEIKNQNGDSAFNIAQKRGNQEIVFMMSLLLFKVKNINDVNQDIYQDFIHNLEELEKLDFPIVIRSSLNEQFKKNIASFKKIEGELATLKIKHDKLQNARKSKKWLNIITFGLYKKRIIKKLLKNRTNNSNKCKELFTERDKMKNNIEEIKIMIAIEKKLLADKAKLQTEQQQLQKELQDKTEELRLSNGIREILKQENAATDKRIVELNDLVQKLNNRVDELQTENAAYREIQNKHNAEAPLLYQNLQKKIKGLEDEVKFYKSQPQSDDSGIETDAITFEFDAKTVNKSDLPIQNRGNKHSLTN